MEYHEGFWITVTTAASVFALTFVVATSGANRLDHDITDLGIWGYTKATPILLISLLGFVLSAGDFVWGIPMRSLVEQRSSRRT
jgi:hypothetical protein